MNKSWWLLAFIVVGVLLGIGILLLVTRPPRGEAIVLQPLPSPLPIMVHVTGEVNLAGLYSLPPGSRVNDAIRAAGGLTDHAYPDALNLAKLLNDGEQIIVPSLNSLSAPGNENSRVIPNLTLVNINSATLEQLDTLPDIGPVTAQKIIDYRNANGPFVKIEDIMDVPDIGQATFDKIKDLITTGTSTP